MTQLKEGLLWLDEKGSLEERVHRAIAYYQTKYKVTPNRCLAPVDMVEEPFMVDKVCKVIGAKAVLKNHLWIGIAP